MLNLNLKLNYNIEHDTFINSEPFEFDCSIGGIKSQNALKLAYFPASIAIIMIYDYIYSINQFLNLKRGE